MLLVGYHKTPSLKCGWNASEADLFITRAKKHRAIKDELERVKIRQKVSLVSESRDVVELIVEKVEYGSQRPERSHVL